MNLTSNQMFWDTLRFAIIMICLTVVLYHNATTFDATELKALAEFGVPLLGVVGLERIIKKKQSPPTE